MTTTSAPMMDTYKRWPVEFVRGRGAVLFDAEEQPYLDLVAGIAVASVGHGHPRVASAIAEQAARLVHVSNLYETAPQRLLAQRLSELTGGMRSFFCNSGAEAIECALKLARKAAGPGRSGIVAASGGFHGRTFGALSATGQPAKAEPFAPLVPGFAHVPFDDVAAMDAAVSRDTAAVVLEPVQGEAGVVVPHEGYLAAVRQICGRAGALLILDEVQTGIARTGGWFAYERLGVEPDILCLAKGLGGGLPIGACLAQPHVADAFAPGDHGSTFGGGPVQCAAALAVLDIVEEEGLLERASLVGEVLRTGLSAIFSSHDVRGAGALIGVSLAGPLARPIAQGCFERKVLVNDPAPDVLRLSPPLVVTEDEIERGLRTIEEVWHEVRAA